MAALKADHDAARQKPKDRVDWLVKRKHVPEEHRDLAERLLKLHEDKQREPAPHMHFDHGAGGGGGSAVLGRLSARQKWERLFSVAGPAGEAIVGAVIIDGMSLGDAAKHLNINHKAMLHMLRFTLDVLART